MVNDSRLLYLAINVLIHSHDRELIGYYTPPFKGGYGYVSRGGSGVVVVVMLQRPVAYTTYKSVTIQILGQNLKVVSWDYSVNDNLVGTWVRVSVLFRWRWCSCWLLGHSYSLYSDKLYLTRMQETETENFLGAYAGQNHMQHVQLQVSANHHIGQDSVNPKQTQKIHLRIWEYFHKWNSVLCQTAAHQVAYLPSVFSSPSGKDNPANVLWVALSVDTRGSRWGGEWWVEECLRLA